MLRSGTVPSLRDRRTPAALVLLGLAASPKASDPNENPGAAAPPPAENRGDRRGVKTGGGERTKRQHEDAARVIHF